MSLSTNNNISAFSLSLSQILEKKSRFKLDYFQREYKWERGHIVQLLDDLESGFYSNWKNTHINDDVADYNCYYMGPIILYKQGSAQYIIDGQQRLTSMTLLLIYLNHLQKSIYSNDESLVDVDKMIYSKPYGTWGYNIDVPERNVVMDKLFREGSAEDIELINDSCINLVERYQDIAGAFPQRLAHPSILSLFMIWLSTKTIFVEINADSDENAYTIFETMNDRGLKLTSSEMLKSHLFSHIKNEQKTHELDSLWKSKTVILHNYTSEEDDEFFKAWLRAKYAVTIRKTEKDSENEDFEKIGSRFHSWVKDYSKKIGLNSPDDYYFFVKANFCFYCDLYTKIRELKIDENQQHVLFLQNRKSIANSLIFPLLLSPILMVDTEEIIEEKLRIVSKFLDAFSAFRSINEKAITQTAVRNYFYGLTLLIRDKNTSELSEIISGQYDILFQEFLDGLPDYIPFDRANAQYLLARIAKYADSDLRFSTILYRRKYDLFPIYTSTDINVRIPPPVLNKIKNSLSNYCLVPRTEFKELSNKSIYDRIETLIKRRYISETSPSIRTDLLGFFAARNKELKSKIVDVWKL